LNIIDLVFMQDSAPLHRAKRCNSFNDRTHHTS